MSHRYTPVGEVNYNNNELVEDFYAVKSFPDIVVLDLVSQTKRFELRNVAYYIGFCLALVIVYSIVLFTNRDQHHLNNLGVSDHLCNINGDPNLCYCPAGMYGSETVVYNRRFTRCFQGLMCHVTFGMQHQRIAEFQSCMLTGACYDYSLGQCYRTRVGELLSSLTCDESAFESFCPHPSYGNDQRHACIYGKMCNPPKIGSNVTITGTCYDMFVNKCM